MFLSHSPIEHCGKRAKHLSLSLSLSPPLLLFLSSFSDPAALARALVKSSINKISRQLNERHNDIGASGRDGGAWRWREKTSRSRSGESESEWERGRDAGEDRAREKVGATEGEGDGFAGSVAWAIHACALEPSKLGARSLVAVIAAVASWKLASQWCTVGRVVRTRYRRREERESRVKQNRESKARNTESRTHTALALRSAPLYSVTFRLYALARSQNSEGRNLPLVRQPTARATSQRDDERAARNMKTPMENQLSWLALFMTALYSREYSSHLSSLLVALSPASSAPPATGVFALLYSSVTETARVSLRFARLFFFDLAISEDPSRFPLRLQKMQVRRELAPRHDPQEFFNWSRLATSELNRVRLQIARIKISCVYSHFMILEFRFEICWR